MTENEISAQILDAAIFVHRALGGPGVLESYYETALAKELMDRGLKVETQKPVPIIFKGAQIGDPFRLDMVVEDKVIVECKATENDNPIFKAQVLTYLRITGLKLGLLINFGQIKLLDGFSRVVNGLDSEKGDSGINAEARRHHRNADVLRS